MNSPAMAKRLVSQVPKTSGTLTDKGGRTVPVNFSLSQWRFFIGEIPAVRTADGELEFLNLADAFDLRDIDEGVTLEGAGIQADISMLSLRRFSVIAGNVHGVSMPMAAVAPQPSGMIHR